MLKLISLLGSTLVLTGCASSIGAFFNRPVVQDQVGPIGTLSQSADRRTVLVAFTGPNAGKFCAEPPPDAATSLKTDLQASLEKTGQKIGFGDNLETIVNVLAERSPALDMFRTGTYSLCNFYLQGSMSSERLSEHFKELVQGFVAVEVARAQAGNREAPVKARPSTQASAASAPSK